MDFDNGNEGDQPAPMLPGGGPPVLNRKRKINYMDNQIGRNCHFLDTPDARLLSPEKGDGMTFGFAAKMTAVGSLPKETYWQMYAALSILESSDVESDILADKSVHVKLEKKGPDMRVASCTESIRDGVDGASVGRKFFKTPLGKLRRTVERMEEEDGHEVVVEYLDAGAAKGKKAMKNGQLYLTIHEVSYVSIDGTKGQFFAVVLWVVCHSHFDFAGKLKRLYGNPEKWQKLAVSGTNGQRAITELPAIEHVFGVWQKVILHQWKLQRNQEIFRHANARQDEDFFQQILDDFAPESFAATTNPAAVFLAIENMCPLGAYDIVVEGMDNEPLDDHHFDAMQYLLRMAAWRRQFARCKERQQREAEAKAAEEKRKSRRRGRNNNNNEENNEEDEAVMVEEEAEGANALQQIEDDTVLFELRDADGPPEFVIACLRREADPFTDSEANLPYVPAWPVEFECEHGDLAVVDDIPRCKIRIAVDNKNIAGNIPLILTSGDPEELQRQWGRIPSSVLAVLEDRTLDHENQRALSLSGNDETVEMGPLDQLMAYRDNYNPLGDYLYDNVYAKHLIDFKALISKPYSREEILNLYLMYIEKMFHTMQTEISSAKLPGLYFQSMHIYLQAIDDSAAPNIAAVLRGQFVAGAPLSGSDFEVVRGTLGSFYSHINYMNLKLSPQNMHFMMNIFLSKILWCCGTAGNWMWIGMPLQVCDAGALTVMLTGPTNSAAVLTNFKKNGTSGFDLTVETAETLCLMYQNIIPSRILEKFNGRDCQDINKVMTCTPGSIGDGVVTMLGNTVSKLPGDTMGQPVVYSEGMGDANTDVIDVALRMTPRDSKLDVVRNSTADPDKTNVRKSMDKFALKGFAFTPLAFAENQQKSVEYVKRKEDFARAESNLFASGPNQRLEEQEVLNVNTDWAYLFSGACTSTAQNSKTTARVSFSDDDERRIAPLVSCLPWIAMKVGLMQKFGIIRWDTGRPVEYVLQAFVGRVGSLLSALVSPLRGRHMTRIYSGALAMGGVSRTLWTRAAARCFRGDAAEEVIKSVTREQHNDAVHFSLVPAVISRFLVMMLDYQSLAVMRVMLQLVGIPKVSVVSAFEMLRGFRVSSDEDRAALQAFVNQAVVEELFGRKNELASVSEDENMEAYVTAPLGDSGHNAMRLTFLVQQAANQDPMTFKRAKLNLNFIGNTKDTLTKYALFDSVNPGVPIEEAINHLRTTEYVFAGFFGGFDLAKNPCKMLQTLFNDSGRFAGMKGNGEAGASSVPMLKVLTLKDGDIGYGMHFATAVFMQALMGGARCDSELQMTVAKNITSYFVEHVVPYSLLPMDEFVLDSYEKRGMVAEMFAKVDRGRRPLTISRSSELAVPLSRKNERSVIEGGSSYGLYEDFAHMHSIVAMKKELSIPDVTMLDLTQWEFEVWWGNPGDCTPLQPFQCTRGGEDEGFVFSPGEGKRACVVVTRNNELELRVMQEDGDVKQRIMEPSAPGSRMEAQKTLFGLGWGPTVHWRRTGVVLELRGRLCTLVPHNYEAAGFEDIVKNGTNSLRWFDSGTMMYSALDADGETTSVTTQVVQDGLLLHKATFLLRESSTALPAGTEFGPSDTEKTGWVQAYLMTDNAKIPAVGSVPVVVKLRSGSAHCVIAPLQDLRIPRDMDEFKSYCKWVHAEGLR